MIFCFIHQSISHTLSSSPVMFPFVHTIPWPYPLTVHHHKRPLRDRPKLS